MAHQLPGLLKALHLIELGTLDAHGYLDRCYDRIAMLEHDVGAWQHLRPRDECHRWLSANADWLAKTPLRGLPVAIKDIIVTTDMPTEMGSRLHTGRQPIDDASCVHKLRAAGALILGKTVTTEFAYFSPGKTANPRDLRCTPGGSSSGSAAAVADGMVPIALGSQTAASVIRPAAYCGVMGYVATRGMMSLRGVQPLAQSLDSLGIIAQNVEDISFIATILAGQQAEQKGAPTPLKGANVLRANAAAIGPVTPDMELAIDGLERRLVAAGAKVTPLKDEGRLARLVDLHRLVMAYEAARNMAFEADHPNAISPAFLDLMVTGRQTKLADYLAARNEVEHLQQWVTSVLLDGSHILAPAAPGSAPLGLEATGAPHMSRPWQLLGLPVLTFAAGLDAEHRPLGAQLIGARWTDRSLLALGGQTALLG